jgi:hypothetical protein
MAGQCNRLSGAGAAHVYQHGLVRADQRSGQLAYTLALRQREDHTLASGPCNEHAADVVLKQKPVVAGKDGLRCQRSAVMGERGYCSGDNAFQSHDTALCLTFDTLHHKINEQESQ